MSNDSCTVLDTQKEIWQRSIFFLLKKKKQYLFVTSFTIRVVPDTVLAGYPAAGYLANSFAR